MRNGCKPMSKKGQRRWTKMIDWTGGAPTPTTGSEERQSPSVLPSAPGENPEAALSDVERARLALASRKKLRLGVNHG